MSFREKSVWVSLLTCLAVYGYYFCVLVGVVEAGESATFHYAALLGRLIVLLTIVAIVLQIAIAIPRPKEAQAARDEREKLIMLKATHIAFYIATSGAAAGCAGAAYGAPSFYLANGLFLTLVVAQLARDGGQIVYFRLGA